MKLIPRFIILFLLYFSIPDFLFSQPTSITGSPFIRNISPLEYNSRPRNWALVQDKDGILYVGNDLNLMTFDGNHWRQITVNNTIVRSLTMDKSGRVYVGAQGDFGYLEKTSIGDLKFISLLNLLDPADRNFTDVWSIHVSDKSLFIHTAFKIFRITGKSVKSWSTNSSYHRSFLINDELYLIPYGTGLLRLSADNLTLVPGGEEFKEHQLSMMIPVNDGKILMGTQRKGIHIFDPKTNIFTHFRNEAEDFLIREGIFCASRLPTGDIAIGTLSGGIIILSPEGKWLLQADENSGLQSNMSLQILPDKHGNLYVANNGISIVEYNSPIRVFNRGNGLSGIVLSSLWVNDILYVGTAEGLFYYNPEVRRFRKIKGVLTQCWNLAAYGQPGKQSLILSSTFGFYEVIGTQATEVRKGNFYNIIAHPENPDLIFCGQEKSITALQKIGNQWQSKTIQMPAYNDLWSGTIDNDLNLWFGTDIFGIIRIPMLNKGKSVGEMPDSFLIDDIEQYAMTSGLPNIYRTYLFYQDGKVYAPSDGGVYSYNKTFDRFELDTVKFRALIGRRIFQLSSDAKGNIWFDSRQGKGMIKNKDNHWVLDNRLLTRFPPTPGYTGHTSKIYCDPYGNTWFGNSEGLFQFTPSKFSKTVKTINPGILIRSVAVNDSILFRGHGKTQTPSISPGKNNLSFSYSTTFSSGIDGNQFSYQLSGFNDQWSAWSQSANQEFLNLNPGNYVFRVKSRSLSGDESDIAEYQFAIEKPWYLSWLMIIGYAVTGIGMIYGLTRWREKATRQEKLRLEKIIADRTRELENRNQDLLSSRQEILSQKEDLEKQKEELTETKKKIEKYNEELEGAVNVRTKALADQNNQLEQFSFVTAHNLRSPVAKIMALVNLIATAPDGNKTEILKKLSQSALDLDSIIRDLGTILELRKGHEIKWEEISLRHTVDLILRSFEELLSRTDIKVRPDIEVDYIVSFPAYLSSILYNLVSNSIKYRALDRIALIDIHISKKDKWIHFAVEDNGIGFDSEKSGNKVFEPFQRLTNQREGKGLGMYLVKSQIEALGGEIRLFSKPGVGTKVEFRLPARRLGEA